MKISFVRERSFILETIIFYNIKYNIFGNINWIRLSTKNGMKNMLKKMSAMQIMKVLREIWKPAQFFPCSSALWIYMVYVTLTILEMATPKPMVLLSTPSLMRGLK